MGAARLELYWIPLGAGAGGSLVRWSGRLYEWLCSRISGRPRLSLLHSALAVRIDGMTTTVEMAPVWVTRGERGVVAEGAVGSRLLGRSRLFRYEVRCWHGGSIPDVAWAVGGPVRIAVEPGTARRILELVPQFPTLVWGRDELHVGDMWNSNSLVSWLLVQARLDLEGLQPPPGSRAPGWEAGVMAASRGRS
ncbi:MAG: hypothetical protein IT198_07395 [Acidimicrobiia bacterium]|nr:hypothetical protein [Acidimicrobiia bacterium]